MRPLNRNENKQKYLTPGVAEWMSLAAAPTFAVMALLTTGHGGAPPDLLCAATHGGSPLCGMTLMYLLMSAFHAGPWLRLRRD